VLDRVAERYQRKVPGITGGGTSRTMPRPPPQAAGGADLQNL
jgi:hypothetical protein